MFEDSIQKHPLTDFEYLVAQRSQRRLRDREFFKKDVWSTYMQANEQLANILKDLCDRLKIPSDVALANLRAFEQIAHEVGFWSGREFTLYKAEWLGRTASMESSCPIEPEEPARTNAMNLMKADEAESQKEEAQREVGRQEMIAYLDKQINKGKKKPKAKPNKAKKSSGVKVKKEKKAYKLSKKDKEILKNPVKHAKKAVAKLKKKTNKKRK